MKGYKNQLAVIGVFTYMCVYRTYTQRYKFDIIPDSITESTRVVKINKMKIVPTLNNVMPFTLVNDGFRIQTVDIWVADAESCSGIITVWSDDKKKWKKY